MAELRSLPGGKKKEPEEQPHCDWCHPLRDCFEQGFNNLNCPRVSAIQFLDGEQIHGDGWHIAAVQFGEPDLELEIPSDSDDD